MNVVEWSSAGTARFVGFWAECPRAERRALTLALGAGANCWYFVFVIDELTLAQMNGQYALPPDAGPAWRSAHEAGLDMSLIEAALKLTPEERLAEHQRILDFLLEVQAAGEVHAAK